MQFLRGLKEPRRLIGVAFWTLCIVGFLASQHAASVGSARVTSTESLQALFSILLLTTGLNGFLQRGLTFQPSDVDFLFCGPFSRRQLVMYRLLSVYPFALVSSAFFLLVLRRATAHPGIAYCGLVLFSLLLVHVQTIFGLLATAVENRIFQRLKTSLRIVAWSLAIGLAFAFMGAVTGDEHALTTLRSIFHGGWTDVALWPAKVVSRSLTAGGWGDAWSPLLGLLAATFVSLLIVLALQVDFLEASITATQQTAALRARFGRGVVSPEAQSGAVHSAFRPRLPFFRGAGAIAWKNLIAVSRSMRFLLFAVLSMGVYTALLIARGRGIGAGEGGVQYDIVSLGAMWPLLLQQYVAFDFRRDIDSLAELRQLPLRPISVAAAEVFVPTFLCVTFQALGVAGIALFESIEPATLLVVALVYPATTLAISTVSNLGFMLFPSRQASAARGRAGGSSLSLVALFNAIVTMVSLAPAAFVGFLCVRFGQQGPVAFGVAFLVQCAVNLSLLWLLGRVYARFDVSRDVM